MKELWFFSSYVITISLIDRNYLYNVLICSTLHNTFVFLQYIDQITAHVVDCNQCDETIFHIGNSLLTNRSKWNTARIKTKMWRNFQDKLTISWFWRLAKSVCHNSTIFCIRIGLTFQHSCNLCTVYF
mgnify:CR=1 FL=1